MLNTTEQQIAAVAESVMDSPPVSQRRRRNAVAYIYQDLGSEEIEYLKMRCRNCSRGAEDGVSCANKHEQSPDCALHDSDSESPSHSHGGLDDNIVSCPRYRVRRNGLANILDPNNTGRLVNLRENNHHLV